MLTRAWQQVLLCPQHETRSTIRLARQVARYQCRIPTRRYHTNIEKCSTATHRNSPTHVCRVATSEQHPKERGLLTGSAVGGGLMLTAYPLAQAAFGEQGLRLALLWGAVNSIAGTGILVELTPYAYILWWSLHLMLVFIGLHYVQRRVDTQRVVLSKHCSASSIQLQLL